MARENKDSGGLHGLVGAAFVVVALLVAPSSAMSASDAQSHAQRALSLFNRGSYNGAIAEYSKAISMEPSNAALFHNRGLAESKLDRYDAAFADFNKAISLEPNNAWLYNARGGISLLKGNLQGAVNDFNKSLSLDPSSQTALENLRRALNAQDAIIKKTNSNRYAAFALSIRRLSYVISGWWASQRNAEILALAGCWRTASDCRLMQVVSNQCFAVANSSGTWGTGIGPVAETAEAEAIRSCQTTGSICKITNSICPPRPASPVYVQTQPQTSFPRTVSMIRNGGGTYMVPVLVNNTVALNFVVDSGASDVSIPSDVASTLFRSGTLTSSDLIGTAIYTLADGSNVPSQRFRIRSLKVGDIVLENVVGSVGSSNSSLLLGQSFLGRFKSWSIDNAKHELVLQ